MRVASLASSTEWSLRIKPVYIKEFYLYEMQTTMGALRFDFINCSEAGTASREFLWLRFAVADFSRRNNRKNLLPKDYTHCR